MSFHATYLALCAKLSSVMLQHVFLNLFSRPVHRSSLVAVWLEYLLGQRPDWGSNPSPVICL